MFDHLTVGIYIREPNDSKLTYASKGLVNIYQVSLEQIYQNSDYWKDMILPEYKEELLDKYEALYKVKNITNIFRIKASTGYMNKLYQN